METLLLSSSDKDIETAGKLLKNSEIVGIPTETVYGLAANALDGSAVAKIFKAKGRPMDNPLIVHISRLEQLAPLVDEIPEAAISLAAAYWPGPLTMIMPCSRLVPREVTAGLSTVAIRLPSHETARRIIDAAGVPLAAPSANTSGKPSPTKASHVMHDMGGIIPAIVDGGDCAYGIESTVITLCGEYPRMLRPGAVTPEMISAVVGKVEVDHAVLEEMSEGETAASPGMKYKHYAPSANVTIVRGSLERFRRYCAEHKHPGLYAMCFSGEGGQLDVPYIEYGSADDLLSQARGLFDALRSLDELNAVRVYARCCEPVGVGLGVYNRLLRAAGFSVVEG